MPKQSENKKDGSWTSDHKFTVCRFLLQKRQAGPPPTSYLLTPYTPFHPSQPFLSLTQFNTFYFPFFLTLPFLYSIQYISFSILPNPSFLLFNSIYIIFLLHVQKYTPPISSTTFIRFPFNPKLVFLTSIDQMSFLARSPFFQLSLLSLSTPCKEQNSALVPVDTLLPIFLTILLSPPVQPTLLCHDRK